ncbi:MYXO-CTERM sorting domain-containing protein, partial [Myxococcota bacterium]
MTNGGAISSTEQRAGGTNASDHRPAQSDDDGGCGCRAARGQSGTQNEVMLLTLLAGLGVLRRRRRGAAP